MSDLVLDGARSRVHIHAFAEGLLARLAHDLELVCNEISGTGTLGADSSSGTASIEARLGGIVVGGVLGKDGRVDPRGLSPTEQRDCLVKMLRDVFNAQPNAILRVEVQLDLGAARIRAIVPNGRAVESVLGPDLRVDVIGDSILARGTFELSLAAIGSAPVKGPMNAFRVKDRVLITFDLVFAPAADVSPLSP